MVAVLIALWSLRLGGHILLRTREVGDDPRYRDLIRQWGANANMRMFLQLQSQAAVGLILAVSVALAAHNTRPTLGLQDFLGMALLVGALAGEAVSDWQLRRFKSDPANRGRICEAGLWSLSRHPNYFFEWLCWLAYPVIAIDLSGANTFGWISLLAPACMYWVLVHVSGVPPLEAHMLRTRGDAVSRRSGPHAGVLPVSQGIIRGGDYTASLSVTQKPAAAAMAPSSVPQPASTSVSCVVQFRRVAWLVRS